MITVGYVGGPPSSPQAQAIQVLPAQAPNPLSGLPGSVVLNCTYWPVDIGNVLGARPSFDSGGVPFMVKQGTCIMVSKTEAAALIAGGYALGV